jgi:cation:H+ antiporter
MYFLYLTFGILLLYYGADFLVKGSSALALSFGVKKIVVGLTLVALGTSMPEFVVSLFGAIDKVDDVSIGNIVGSNLANILLVLGLASIIRPIPARRRIFYIELPVLFLITGLFVGFCHNGILSGLEGGIMLTCFLGYMGYILHHRHEVSQNGSIITPCLNPVDCAKRSRNLLLSFIGLAGLILGGNLTVKGAIGIARMIGISELVIGLTVVALGTSLPELFTSVVAIIKKEDEISIGNIIGSNLFNIGFVLGVIPLIYSLHINARIIGFDNLFMMGVTLLLGLFLLIGRHLSRAEGIILLVLYVAYILNLGFNFI